MTADAARRPVPRPPPRRVPGRPSPPSRRVAEVTSRPCAGVASVAANGMVGSSQCRCSPTSMSRFASRRSRRRNRTCAWRSPGSGPRLGHVAQHRLPCLQRHQGAAVQGTADRLDPQAGGLVQVLRLRRPAGRAGGSRNGSSGSVMRPSARRSDPRRGSGLGAAGNTSHSSDIARTSSGPRAVGPGSGGGRGAGTPRSDCAGRARRRRVRVLPPAGGWTSRTAAARGSLQGGIQRRLQVRPIRDQVLHPPRRPAGARSCRPPTRAASGGVRALSAPDRAAEKALSAASNTWWPSSKT